MCIRFEVVGTIPVRHACGCVREVWTTYSGSERLARATCRECWESVPPPGLGTVELRAALVGLGVTHMETYGGPIPVGDWDPYGFEGVNREPGRYRGEIVSDDSGIRVRDARRPSWTEHVEEANGRESPFLVDGGWPVAAMAWPRS